MLLTLSDLDDYADIQWQQVLVSTRGTSEGLAWYKKQKHRTCTFFPCPYFQKSFDYQMLSDSDSIALGFLVLQLGLSDNCPPLALSCATLYEFFCL